MPPLDPTHSIASALPPPLAPGPLPGIEASTIDRYQGRDKACIILSFVRASDGEGGGEGGRGAAGGRLLRDRERINVALTRAKHKLIMVGCAGTLRASAPVLGELLDEVDRRGWRLQLAPTQGPKNE